MSMPPDAALTALDLDVRLHIYQSWMAGGSPPLPVEVSRFFGVPVHDLERSLERLQGAHAVVLLPGSHYLWMATPFSAVPTHYEVVANGRSWWANCIWDAVSVAPLVGESTVVRSWCNDCGDPIEVSVHADRIVNDGLVAHFAVPACEWWHDLGYT